MLFMPLGRTRESPGAEAHKALRRPFM
jgi:hypothetical protein